MGVLLVSELGLVQSQISEFRVDLIKQNVDLVKLVDSKAFLSFYFYENEKSMGLWFEMVNFLFGAMYENPQKFSQIEMIRLIKNRLA